MKVSTRIFVLAASAALSMFAAAGAQAGTTISDRRYWPNEIRSSPVDTATSPFDAMASMNTTRPAGNAFIYRGGPKTGTLSYY
jgi:hypothetical protein